MLFRIVHLGPPTDVKFSEDDVSEFVDGWPVYADYSTVYPMEPEDLGGESFDRTEEPVVECQTAEDCQADQAGQALSI